MISKGVKIVLALTLVNAFTSITTSTKPTVSTSACETNCKKSASIMRFSSDAAKVAYDEKCISKCGTTTTIVKPTATKTAACTTTCNKTWIYFRDNNAVFNVWKKP